MEDHPQRSRPSVFAIACLAAALVASAALLLYAGRGQVIREDAMFYAFRLAHDPFAEAAFTSPLNLYLIALPLALYRGMFEVFGLGVDLPYRLVSTALVLACGVLFYTLARRRIGDLAAILPTALLVLFGAAGEVVASAIRIPMLIAIAAGLGALLALERRDLRGDLLAATLLVASVLSHPVALGFLLAATVVLWFRPPPERWTRAWIVLIPGAVFAVWWALVRTPAPGVESRASFADVLDFGWDSWVSVTSAASGLSGVLPEPPSSNRPRRCWRSWYWRSWQLGRSATPVASHRSTGLRSPLSSRCWSRRAWAQTGGCVSPKTIATCIRIHSFCSWPESRW